MAFYHSLYFFFFFFNDTRFNFLLFFVLCRFVPGTGASQSARYARAACNVLLKRNAPSPLFSPPVSTRPTPFGPHSSYPLQLSSLFRTHPAKTTPSSRRAPFGTINTPASGCTATFPPPATPPKTRTYILTHLVAAASAL